MPFEIKCVYEKLLICPHYVLLFFIKCPALNMEHITIHDYQICYWKCNRNMLSILNLVLNQSICG